MVSASGEAGVGFVFLGSQVDVKSKIRKRMVDVHAIEIIVLEELNRVMILTNWFVAENFMLESLM